MMAIKIVDCDTMKCIISILCVYMCAGAHVHVYCIC